MAETVCCPRCLAIFGREGYRRKEGEDRECEACGGSGVCPASDYNLEKGRWCQCEEDEDSGSDEVDDEDRPPAIYHKNGRTIWKTCVYKHHWHCGRCRGLVQIG
jgi:hypothetical protein